MKLAEPMLDERFAVLNGDILTDIDLSRCVALPRRSAARARRSTLTPVEDPSSYGVVVTDDDGPRRGVPREAGTGHGAQRTSSTRASTCSSARCSSEIPAGRAVSFEREVFPSLVGHGLYGLELEGYWLDIGTPERYLQATRDILSGEVETAVQPGSGPGPRPIPRRWCSSPA